MSSKQRALQQSSIGRVLTAGGGLLALAAISYALSFARLGALGLVLALAIAALKALVVLWFFMQFGRLPASAKLAALAACFMLALMLSLMAADIALREPEPSEPPAGAALRSP
jgi:cytochrome c oxidase subunit 4